MTATEISRPNKRSPRNEKGKSLAKQLIQSDQPFLLAFFLLTSIDFPAYAANQTVSASPALSVPRKDSPAEKSRKELQKTYAVTDDFIQGELDKGYTLDEVKQALALTKKDKKLK